MSCCGPTGGEVNQKDMPELYGRRSEETRALVSSLTLRSLTTSRSRRRKRGTTSPSSATVVAVWKPTLCSISEDNVVMVVEEGTERVVKRKSSGGGGSRNIASVASFNEDYRHNNHFTAIPTFSATPFMF
ncbi:hypothetical protein JCGZ_00769 [Jatropha curcas]|uniref:Uncharacterized protein n=2 Tax=Jatropha curcas TaxID=180498 RepID=A0A067KSA1_JATCU|nr:hypothetical protein JCGZ_00769 [Jatropha curcas]